MFHVNVALFMTTRIAFMAYLSSLTGMRRLAFALSEWFGKPTLVPRAARPREVTPALACRQGHESGSRAAGE
jgi:hypothetical protein